MKLNLHIERLCLEGIEMQSVEAKRLGDSIETELARLFVAGCIAPDFMQNRVLPVIKTPDIELTGRDGRNVGRLIAHSLYGGLGDD